MPMSADACIASLDVVPGSFRTICDAFDVVCVFLLATTVGIIESESKPIDITSYYVIRIIAVENSVMGVG